MDAKIRSLLTQRIKHGAPASGADTLLQQAFELLQNVAETHTSVDTPESVGQVYCVWIFLDKNLLAGIMHDVKTSYYNNWGEGVAL